MTTDTAQVYKAKLIEITKKISDIESLGFNVANLNKVLNEIIEKYQVSIKKSKNNSFEGYIINDYTNAINELNKLDSALDKYNIYFVFNLKATIMHFLCLLHNCLSIYYKH